ncbi:MAG: APC family permease, partial [Lysobacterales bacterium]
MAALDNGPAENPLVGEEARLRPVVGRGALAASIVNVIVGGGIFVLPAAVAGHIGVVAPVAYLLGALVIVTVAICFALAGRRVLTTGGPYAYAENAFGPFAGFLTGIMMWLANVTACAGVAVALHGQLGRLWPVFATPFARTALLTTVFAALFALNARGMRLGMRAIVTLAVLKLTPLVLLVAIGVWFIDPSALLPASSTLGAVHPHAMGAALVLVMFAYSGMETALTPAAEMRDARRDLPQATLWATAFVVVLYFGLQAVAQGLLGPALAGDATPLASAAGRIHPAAATALLVTAAISMLGFLQGNLVGTSRLVYALARDRQLPSQLAHVSRGSGVPVVALALHAAVAWGLAMLGNFATLALLSGGANCLLYALVALAAWRLARRDPATLPGQRAFENIAPPFA